MLSLGLSLTGIRYAAPPVVDPFDALYNLFTSWPGVTEVAVPTSLDPARGNMWQDAARTVPVTAADQPVRSYRYRTLGVDIHVAPSVDTRRPILCREPWTGRRNLLTYSEDLTVALWTKTAGADTATLSDSGYTTLAFTTTSTDRRHVAYQAVPDVPTGEQAFLRARFRPGAGVTRLALGTRSGGAVFGWASYDIGAGTWENYSVSTPGTYEGISAVEVAAGVWELVVRYTSPSGGRPGSVLVHFGSGSASDLRLNSPICACDVGLVQWARTDAAYQRVVSARDVSEAGVPDRWGLELDGIDDGFISPTITPGSDKVQVFAGVTRNGSSVAMIAEYSHNAGTAQRSFYLAAPAVAGQNRYHFLSRGSLIAFSQVDHSGYPDTAAVVGIGDISGDFTQTWRNGVAGTPVTTDQGDGPNFFDYPIYIGSRNDSALRFFGKMWLPPAFRFGTIPATPQIQQANAIVADISGVTI